MVLLVSRTPDMIRDCIAAAKMVTPQVAEAITGPLQGQLRGP